jgi:5-methylcytosine-specific restriction protein A
MPRRALAPCSRPGCPNLTDSGRCPTCAAVADAIRGTASQRGYTSRGHQRFRRLVLRRDPTCVLCGTAIATVADHHPRSRRQLAAAGLNPDDPAHGRGLCKPCHDRATAQHQPGGWHRDAP